MTNKTTKPAIFSWNEKNTQTVCDLYIESGNDNSKENLQKIASAVGAKSVNSIRSKLSTSKVYVKVESATSAKKATTKITKVERVQNLESILGLQRDDLDTLEKANAVVLDTLTERFAELGQPEAVKQAYTALMEAEAEAQAEKEAEAEAEELNELANAE